MKHLINIGYTFKGRNIFIETDTPGEAGQFRELLKEKILEPANRFLQPHVSSEETWKDPL